MKKLLAVMLISALLGCIHSAAIAAELLDVKPVVSGTTVAVEVTADIAMTYTYYKVPGQARAVVDIAEADPEKVEPLIVVNKGAVSSISVDKAQISGLVVSRIIFNLVSEADISVSATPDRKKLTVTFGSSSTAAAKVEQKAEPKPEPKAEPEPAPKPETKAEPATTAAAKVEPPSTPAAAANPDDDPLGLDEPAAKTAKTAAPAEKAATASTAAAATAVTAAKVETAAVAKASKLEPVVPVAVSSSTKPSALSIKDVSAGASFIEIRVNQPVTDYKTFKLTGPDRLVIDIAADKINQKPKTFFINKFGISKTRIGVSPKYIRIVLDSNKAGFPAYTITNSDDGLRVNFK